MLAAQIRMVGEVLGVVPRQLGVVKRVRLAALFIDLGLRPKWKDVHTRFVVGEPPFLTVTQARRPGSGSWRGTAPRRAAGPVSCRRAPRARRGSSPALPDL